MSQTKPNGTGPISSPLHRLAAIIESSDDAIVTKTLTGTVTSWNPAAERIFGYTAEEMIGRSITTLFPPELLGDEDEFLRRIARDEHVEHYETQRIRKDGRRIEISVTISPVRDDAGRIVEVSKIARDITERKRLDAQAAEQREWFRVTLESIGDAVIATDTDARITFMNSTAESLAQWSASDAIGRRLEDVFDIFNERTGRRVENPVAVVLREGRIVGMANHTVLRRRDGTDLPIDDSAAPIRDRDGRVVGVVLVFRDVVERKRAEGERARLLAAEQAARAEAERANHGKDAFIATLSHELRTPLNAMLGWTRMLQGQQLGSATATRGLQVVERNILVQVQLIEDLLDISRVTTGKLVLDVRSTDFQRVIDDAIEVIRPSADAKNISIATACDPAARTVVADADRLQRIVWNLLANAVKYTPPGGAINVALEQADGTVVLVVRDTGQGIAPEMLPYIFERFSQGQPPAAAARTGLGLGLSIVRHLVEAHGGTVHASSGGKGQGSTFTVRLPIREATRSPADLPPAEVTTSAGPSLDGVRLLVVEDDEDARDLLELVLEQAGADVVAVDAAAAARRELESSRFDVLVSDLALGDDNGYDLMRYVRSLPADRNGRTPALAVTAQARAEDRRRALLTGFHAFLAKPVEPIEIVAAVANLAGRRPED